MTRMRTIQSTFLGFCDDGLNLTSYLAQEGHDEAVQHVMTLGGKIEDAIYGYALAGNSSQVEALCAQCSPPQQAFAVGSAMTGYARAGNLASILAISNYSDYMADILLGAAQAGDASKVKSILSSHINLLPKAVEGYADCNHEELLSKLIKGKSFYPLAIYCAARSGHVDLVGALLLQCGVGADYTSHLLRSTSSNLDTNAREIKAYSLINQALKGYIAGCHFNEALVMIARGANISQGLATLHHADDECSLDLYIALLAHNKDKKINQALLEQMQLRGQVLAELKITPAVLEQVDQIKVCMNSSHLNYVEAKNKVEDDSYSAFSEDELTLDFLGKTVGQELGLESVSPAVKPI